MPSTLFLPCLNPFDPSVSTTQSPSSAEMSNITSSSPAVMPQQGSSIFSTTTVISSTLPVDLTPRVDATKLTDSRVLMPTTAMPQLRLFDALVTATPGQSTFGSGGFHYSTRRRRRWENASSSSSEEEDDQTSSVLNSATPNATVFASDNIISDSSATVYVSGDDSVLVESVLFTVRAEENDCMKLKVY